MIRLYNKAVTFFGKATPIVFTVFAFFIIYFPIFIITLLSFNDSKKDYDFTGFSLRWYQAMFQDAQLMQAIGNTLLIAVLSTIIATILGTITAIGINSLTKKNRVRLMILNNIPVINPDIVTGISLMLVFSLFPISFGMGTVLLAHVFFSIPFVVLTVLPKLKELDPNLYDAALDLGCNHVTAIFKVIIPSIKTGIIAGALIAFTMSIDDFVISYFTTGNGFNNVSIWIYARIGRKSFSKGVYAYNTMVTVITITTLFIVNRLHNKKRLKENTK